MVQSRLVYGNHSPPSLSLFIGPALLFQLSVQILNEEILLYQGVE